MKIFISHKKEDTLEALQIQNTLKYYGMETYLDILDESIKEGGKSLTDHIKRQLNSCTDIIVVMSEQTKLSWWVPFEVGMSAQIDMPTATFLHGDISLPSYLSYWPRLKNLNDVTTYIKVRKKVEASSQRLQEHYSAAERRKIQTELFYDALKRELR